MVPAPVPARSEPPGPVSERPPIPGPAPASPSSPVALPAPFDDAARLLLAGEFQRAADAFASLASGDLAPVALAGRAVALLKREDVAGAVAAADLAVAARSTADTHAVRSIVRFRAGRFRAACDDVARAQTLATGRSALAHLCSARLLLSEGKVEQALAAANAAATGEGLFDRAFRCDSNLVRADALDELGRSSDAVAALDAALAAAPPTNAIFVANLKAQLEFRKSVAGRRLYDVETFRDPIVLPLTFVSNLAVVTMSVNGAPPAPFIVDTGAGISVIFAKYAKAADFASRTEPAFAGAVGGNGRVPIRFGLAETASFGGVTVRSLPMIRIDWEIPGFAGIIGMPLLREFQTTFDYPAGKLVLARHGSAAPEGAVKGSVPIRLVGQGVFVEVTLNGRGPFNFEIDTGAASPGLPVDERAALSIGLHPGSPNVRKGRGAGASGSQQTHVHPGVRFAWAGMPEATLDAIAQTISPARAERRDGESGITTETELEGLVGFEALKGYRVTFDFASWTVTLR